MKYNPVSQEIEFDSPLERAVIIDRPNRFIVNVEVDGELVRAHCPVTGKIGGLELSGLPCLVSRAPVNSKRTTTHTLEAIAVEDFSSEAFQWIGVNQTRVNRFVEVALERGLLGVIPEFQNFTTLQREPSYRSSRLDFLLDGKTFVEVKMPVKNLQVDIPDTVAHSTPAATGTDRMLKQVRDLMAALKHGKKAVLLTVFVYDNPGFVIPKAHNSIYKETVKTLTLAKTMGLARWQVNFSISETGVRVEKVVQQS